MSITASKPHAPSGTGTGARWAASGWNTPLAAQWADSRTAWQEGIREAVVIPLLKRIFKIDFCGYTYFPCCNFASKRSRAFPDKELEALSASPPRRFCNSANSSLEKLTPPKICRLKESQQYGAYPKIEVVRSAISRHPVNKSADLLAVYSDIEHAVEVIPVLRLDDYEGIAALIIRHCAVL